MSHKLNSLSIIPSFLLPLRCLPCLGVAPFLCQLNILHPPLLQGDTVIMNIFITERRFSLKYVC